MLLAAAIGVTMQTFHGLGRHIWDSPDATVEDINANTLTGLLCITFTVCSGVWSKTSWGITLLRVSEGKIRVLIWFAIISMNVFFAVTAMVYWIPCTPVEKAWRPLTPGVCVDQQYGLTMGITASSRCTSRPSRDECPKRELTYGSILWHRGSHLRHHPMVDTTQSTNTTRREDWSGRGHVDGCLRRHMCFHQGVSPAGTRGPRLLVYVPWR